jgi:hypothetical protein
VGCRGGLCSDPAPARPRDPRGSVSLAEPG